MRGVVAFGDRFVGVGYDIGDAAVWHTATARWTGSAPSRRSFLRDDVLELDMRDVAVLAGRARRSGRGRGPPTTTRTPPCGSPADSETWTLVTNEEVFGGSDDQRILGVTAGDFGIVAVGCSGCRGEFVRPVVWTSVDGETWTRTDADQLPSAGSAAQLNAVSVVGTTVVALGWEQGPSDQDATVWTAPLPG